MKTAAYIISFDHQTTSTTNLFCPAFVSSALYNSEDRLGILNWDYQVRQSFKTVMHQEKTRHSVTLTYQRSPNGTEAVFIEGVLDTSLQLYALCHHLSASPPCPQTLNVSWTYHISTQ